MQHCSHLFHSHFQPLLLVNSVYLVNEQQSTVMPFFIAHERWYALYHAGLVPILMPLACALAIFNNGVVILVATGSCSLKRYTLPAIRLLIIALAITDVCIVIFSRAPLVFGIC